MRLYLPALSKIEYGVVAKFFGEDLVNGWLYIDDNSGFDRVFCDEGLAFCDDVKSIHSTNQDLVLEESDLVEVYARLSSFEEAKSLVIEIIKRIENGGNC